MYVGMTSEDENKNKIVTKYDSPTSITTLPTYEPYFKQMTVIISLEDMLSSEIGNLRSLEYLELRENNFDGHIPTDLGLLQSLTLLDISDLECIAEASMPSEVGNLSSPETSTRNVVACVVHFQLNCLVFCRLKNSTC